MSRLGSHAIDDCRRNKDDELALFLGRALELEKAADQREVHQQGNSGFELALDLVDEATDDGCLAILNDDSCVSLAERDDDAALDRCLSAELADLGGEVRVRP